jgi:hypothetical protein
MKKILISLFSIGILGCATTKKIDESNVELRYLDDVIIPQNLKIEGTKIGGLSAIDYHKGMYYLVCDQASQPRIYKAEIPLINRSIDTVIIKDVIVLKDNNFYTHHTPDLEGIRINKNELVISAEGSIQNNKHPSVFTISTEGAFLSAYQIPEYFKASGTQKPRNNGVFEGLSESFDKSGYWVATELPLELDGPKPKIYPTKSPLRFTKLNKNTKTAQRQFVYTPDGISKFPINWFAINGVTEILEYAEDKFLVLERAYSAGYGSNGNTVKIFDVDASKATNTLKMENLSKNEYQKASKRLVFNFKSVKEFLTKKTIDNIEGMTFGPDLPNGKKSLILVSDDNFSSFSDQITQFILLELEIK